MKPISIYQYIRNLETHSQDQTECGEIARELREIFPMNRKPLFSEIAGLIIAINNCKVSGNKEWEIKHGEKIEMINDLLPKGSGFNQGSTINLETSKPDFIIINSGFHPMDENGFYIEWVLFDIIITPSLGFGFELDITYNLETPINDIPDLWGLEDYILETFNYIIGSDVYYNLEENRYETER